MKKFLKWFIGIIIVAAIAFGVCKYMDWGYCDNTCETPVTEVPTDVIEQEAAEDMIEIDTMIEETSVTTDDTIQNTSAEVVNE